MNGARNSLMLLRRSARKLRNECFAKMGKLCEIFF